MAYSLMLDFAVLCHFLCHPVKRRMTRFTTRQAFQRLDGGPQMHGTGS